MERTDNLPETFLSVDTKIYFKVSKNYKILKMTKIAPKLCFFISLLSDS